MKIKSIIISSLLFSTTLSIAFEEPFDLEETKRMIVAKATEFFTSLAEPNNAKPKENKTNQIWIDFNKLNNYIKENKLYIPTNKYEPRNDATKRRMFFTELLQEAVNATKDLANTKQHIVFFDNEAWIKEDTADHMIIIQHNRKSFSLEKKKNNLSEYVDRTNGTLKPCYAKVESFSEEAAKNYYNLKETIKNYNLLLFLDKNIPTDKRQFLIPPTASAEYINCVKKFLCNLIIVPSKSLFKFAIKKMINLALLILVFFH